IPVLDRRRKAAGTELEVAPRAVEGRARRQGRVTGRWAGEGEPAAVRERRSERAGRARRGAQLGHAAQHAVEVARREEPVEREEAAVVARRGRALLRAHEARVVG